MSKKKKGKKTKKRKIGLKNESEVRQGLMDRATKIGAAEDLSQLFDKWDRAIALAPPSERIDMARMAILEVQSLLDVVPTDGLTINDEVVIGVSKEKHDTIFIPTAVKEKV